MSRNNLYCQKLDSLICIFAADVHGSMFITVVLFMQLFLKVKPSESEVLARKLSLI